jgi:hypothetical protein
MKAAVVVKESKLDGQKGGDRTAQRGIVQAAKIYHHIELNSIYRES